MSHFGPRIVVNGCHEKLYLYGALQHNLMKLSNAYIKNICSDNRLLKLASSKEVD